VRVLHVVDNALASASDQEMPGLGLSRMFTGKQHFTFHTREGKPPPVYVLGKPGDFFAASNRSHRPRCLHEISDQPK